MTTHSVLVAGATGTIGRQLIPALQQLGIKPVVLTRRKERARRMFARRTLIARDMLEARQEGPFDAIINLVGVPVLRGAWLPGELRREHKARLAFTDRLVAAVEGWRPRPKMWLQASCTALYGGSEAADEAGRLSNDAVTELVLEAEAHAGKAAALGLSVAALRFGMVLARHGGALPKLDRMVRLGLPSRAGAGTQALAWTSVDDAVNAVAFLLEQPDPSGVWNICSPRPANQLALAQAIAAERRRRQIRSVSERTVLRLLGNRAGVLLQDRAARPARLEAEGFTFQHSELAPTVSALLARR